MRIALLHIRTERPRVPAFQRLLDEFNRVAVAAVEGLGWRAELIAAAEQPVSRTLAQTRSAGAIVILGGEDVDPRLYGGPSDYPGSGHHEPLADEAQIAVVQQAVQAGTPVLGICRGHQIANVALGGSLHPHLPDDGAHRLLTGDRIELVPHRPRLEGELAQELDADAPVRCGHHQAVREPGSGMRIVARAADGTIEAGVHETAPITGVQWHPEHPDAEPSQLRALLRRLERQAAA